MNSIRAISINSLNDDKSHSTSVGHTNWKIEKYTDSTGKMNYKIKTEKPSLKSKWTGNSIPAYGVPGSKGPYLRLGKHNIISEKSDNLCFFFV